jgi:hypothetical protein
MLPWPGALRSAAHRQVRSLCATFKASCPLGIYVLLPSPCKILSRPPRALILSLALRARYGPHGLRPRKLLHGPTSDDLSTRFRFLLVCNEALPRADYQLLFAVDERETIDQTTREGTFIDLSSIPRCARRVIPLDYPSMRPSGEMAKSSAFTRRPLAGRPSFNISRRPHDTFSTTAKPNNYDTVLQAFLPVAEPGAALP